MNSFTAHSPDKKTILFTIELADRELLAKTVLSLEMVRRGFRVYLGSFRAIHEIRRQLDSCIFFHKSAYRRRVAEYKRRMNAVIAVLDEEMGVAIPLSRQDVVCAERYKTFDRRYYDFVFTIGEGYRQRLEGLPCMNGIKVVASGWPRIDLWREEFRAIHRDKVDEIRQRYGEYLLFISSFGFTSKMGYHHSLAAATTPEERAFVDNTYTAFSNYVDLLRRLACERGGLVIIRPHTSESLDDWQALFAEFPNVLVIREGDVTPWLLAASSVVAYRSTVVLQAAMNGIPVVQYKINEIDGIDDVPVFKVSKCVDTYEEVVTYLDNNQGEDAHQALKRQAAELLHDEVSALDGERAASRIADTLNAVALMPQPEIRVSALMRALSYAWDRYKYFEHRLRKALLKQRASVRPSRFDKIPNGIQAAEIADIVYRLQGAGFVTELDVVCRQVSTNLVMLEVRP